MRRDPAPTAAVVAVSAAALMAAAERAVCAHHSAPLAAAEAIRTALASLWDGVPPEAVRDVLVTAARGAVEGGSAVVPAVVAARWPARDLFAAAGLLKFAGAAVASGCPERGPAKSKPLQLFASSCAFDRDEDGGTLTSLAVLLALAHLGPRPWDE